MLKSIETNAAMYAKFFIIPDSKAIYKTLSLSICVISIVNNINKQFFTDLIISKQVSLQHIIFVTFLIEIFWHSNHSEVFS